MTPSRPIAALLAAAAFLGACAMHEVVGHAGACLAAGGAVTRLSSVYFACHGGGVAADLGGPLGNAIAAMPCLILLRAGRPGDAVHLALALACAFNLLWIGGCLLESAAVARSDFAYAAHLLGRGEAPARIGCGLLGAGVGITTCALLERQRLPRPTLRLAYGVAGVVACAAALGSSGPALPALREGMLEGFCAMAWLLFVRPGRGGAATPSGSCARRAP